MEVLCLFIHKEDIACRNILLQCKTGLISSNFNKGKFYFHLTKNMCTYLIIMYQWLLFIHKCLKVLVFIRIPIDLL